MSDPAVRNFRDFLLIYNKMSDMCFSQCVNNLNNRSLSEDEIICVDKCAGKSININHKVMSIYMEVQPEIINKRIQDVNEQLSKGNAGLVEPQ